MNPSLNPATEAAIEWLVCLHSGQMSQEQRRGFEQWLEAAPAHRAAWQQLQPLRSSGPEHMGQLLGQTLARAEAGTRRRRQILRGALALGGITTGCGWLLDRQTPLAQWSAKLRTDTGQRRDFTLPDGSTVTLDARSAADLAFDAGQRRVILRQGALVARAAPQTPGGPAFVVQTMHGQIHALGTRFSVRLNPQFSSVGMLEHSVSITTVDGAQQVLAEGHSARFDTQGIWADASAPSSMAAWQQGMLEAHDLPLGEVVQALRAYRRGWIRVSAHAAALQVYGTYSLEDTDRALAALAETLPIRLRSYSGGALVMIE